MKKIIISIILITYLLNAKDSNLTNLTEAQLIAEFMKLDTMIKKEQEEIKVEKAKTKAVKQLGKTVDKLAKKLGVK